MAEKWIQGAIKHPRGLDGEGQGRGRKRLAVHAQKHKDPTTRREVALARTLMAMHRRRKGK